MTGAPRIDCSGFAQAIGYEERQVDERTVNILDKANLVYEPINRAGQLEIEAEIEKQIAKGFTVVGEHRSGIWRDAWQDQLDHFEQSKYDLKALNPNFVAAAPILRWQGQYIRGIAERFELLFLEIFRDWLFRTHLADIGHLYEFGSGSAFNVAAYAQLFPETSITALDWAPAAVKIATLLASQHGMKISGRKFDFFAPDRALELHPQSGVLTMCALEQTGDRFNTFLDYLVACRPKRVVHVEPTPELYDPTSSHDRLALEYHKQRKYLTGLLPALQRLAQENKVRISWTRRLHFGSRFHECYTIIVWEPV